MVPAVQIALDANDPLAIAAFWAEVLGYDTTPSLDTVTNPETVAHIGLVDPDRTRPSIFIQRVPEPKTVKNRVHLDLDVGGGPDVPVSDRRACIEGRVRFGARRPNQLGRTHTGACSLQDSDIASGTRQILVSRSCIRSCRVLVDSL